MADLPTINGPTDINPSNRPPGAGRNGSEDGSEFRTFEFSRADIDAFLKKLSDWKNEKGLTRAEQRRREWVAQEWRKMLFQQVANRGKPVGRATRPGITNSPDSAPSSLTGRDHINVKGDIAPAANLGSGSVAVKGGVAGHDHIGTQINVDTLIYNGAEGAAKTDDSLSDAERAYLVWLREMSGRIPLGKLDLQLSVQDRSTPNIRLKEIYVPLDILRTQKARQQSTDRHPRVPVPALEAIMRADRLVILGDPGSGKTTLLNYITLALAEARLYPDFGHLERLSVEQTEDRKAANWNHGALLPIRVDLREFVRDIPGDTKKGTANLVWKHIVSQLEALGLGDFSDEMRHELRGGRAIVMFDGLDEIIDTSQRNVVRQAVEAFAGANSENIFVVTCRVLSYTDPKWQLSSFNEVTLAPLRSDSIIAFINQWYDALARMRYRTIDQAYKLAQQLHNAVQELPDLAQNPMLLTVMAVVHTYKGHLPRERARLYQDCVQLLLWDWQRAKQTATGDWESGIVDELDTREERLINGLCEVAFQAHSALLGDGATKHIPQRDVLCVLKRYLDNDWGKAQKFCEYVEKRAGLLIGKGRNRKDEAMYAFPHRGFQEFLAAHHVVTGHNFHLQVAELAKKSDVWHEVLRLAIGDLVFNHNDVNRPLAAINLLVGDEPPKEDTGWRLVWLAADMLTIVNRSVAEQDEYIGKKLVKRLMGQLVQLVTGDHLMNVERAQAADILGWLGDPRPGVCTKKPELLKLESAYVEIGADDERHRIRPRSFYLAKYPVTNAQFRQFVESKDYHNDKYWTEEGCTWRKRSSVHGGYVNAPGWGIDNRPVVGITWYEALAYANWLRDKTGKPYRLPSEAEWEYAAAGKEGRRYSFGTFANDNSANIRKAGIGHTTAVGIFAEDITPEGIADLGGNIWEWTLSLDRKYPYKASDGREDLERPGARVLRGGGYDGVRQQLHASHRRPVDPGARVTLIGFRLACDAED